MMRKLYDGIPSLAEFVGVHEDMAGLDALHEWIEKTLAVEAAVAEPRARRIIRLVQVLMVAAVETCNRESRLAEECGEAPSPDDLWAIHTELLHLLPRAAGYVTMGTAASVLRQDVQWRSISRIFREEFSIGAKMFADQMEEKLDKPVGVKQ